MAPASGFLIPPTPSLGGKGERTSRASGRCGEAMTPAASSPSRVRRGSGGGQKVPVPRGRHRRGLGERGRGRQKRGFMMFYVRPARVGHCAPPRAGGGAPP